VLGIQCSAMAVAMAPAPSFTAELQFHYRCAGVALASGSELRDARQETPSKQRRRRSPTPRRSQGLGSIEEEGSAEAKRRAG